MKKQARWEMAYSPKNRPAEILESPEPKEMKKKRFTEAQVIGILRHADRGEQTNGKICRAHGVSEQSFYSWR